VGREVEGVRRKGGGRGNREGGGRGEKGGRRKG
jgi:hypothetical protein